MPTPPYFQLAAGHIQGNHSEVNDLITKGGNRVLSGQDFARDLNSYADRRRKTLQPDSLARANLFFDTKAVIMLYEGEPLMSSDNSERWATDAEAAASHNPRRLGRFLTDKEDRDQYIRFTALHRLRMAHPERGFFTPAEIQKTTTEVLADQTFQGELALVIPTPNDMRTYIYNNAAIKYWKNGGEDLEIGREMVRYGPQEGMSKINDDLTDQIVFRNSGAERKGTILPTNELIVRKAQVRFSDDYIAIENALHANINELDRIKIVLRTSPENFEKEYQALAKEYREKYKDAPNPNPNSLATAYKNAKNRVLAQVGQDLSNNPEARLRMARDIHDMVLYRRMILTSRYDPEEGMGIVTANSDVDGRQPERIRNETEAWVNDQLGTPEQFAQRLAQPGMADALAQDNAKMEAYLKLAESGADTAALAEFLNPIAVEAKRQDLASRGRTAAEPSANIMLTCISGMGLYYLNPLTEITSRPNERPFTRDEQDQSFRLIQRFSAYNKLLLKNPGRMVFTDMEFREAMREVEKDPDLKRILTSTTPEPASCACSCGTSPAPATGTG